MRLAAVDIGSNTVHVLVADVVRNKLEEVAHYVEMPELGARVARTGSIGTKGRFAIRALRSVVNRARKDGYDTLLAAATEAVREAELSFLGVATYHAARREWAMADLGGGSTEVVIARGREMLRSAALPIGSGVLSSTYLSDPPTPEERARLRKAALRGLTQAPDGEVDRFVATGGTASNLPIVLSRRNPPSVL